MRVISHKNMIPTMQQLHADHWMRWSMLVVCFCAISGCSGQRPLQRVTDARFHETLDDMRFFHFLATQPVVTVDEGARAVLLLLLAPDEAPVPPPITFEERVEALTERRAWRESFEVEPDQPLDYGTLAYMLTGICATPRSASEAIARTSGLGLRRYALKTCVYYKLLPPSPVSQPVSGGALLSTITAAQNYRDQQTPAK